MYKVEGGEQKQTTMWVRDDHGNMVEPYSSESFKFATITTRRKTTIATMWIGCPGSKTTILFSHGNAADLGCMRDHLLDMSAQLGVNVFVYDYSGYGLSNGKPTYINILADVEAAYDYLVTNYAASAQTVILYGQSIGSGPTCYLATQRKVAGVVIHSGLMSCLRVIRPKDSTPWFDLFPNIDWVRQIKAPLFVLHGTEDVEVPVQHGLALSESAPNAYKPWIIEGAGHNNIEIMWREALWGRVREFVRFCEKGPASAAPTGKGEHADVPPVVTARQDDAKGLP